VVVNRTSKQITKFLGAEITARNTGGGLRNTFKNNLGGERTRQPDAIRGSTSDFEAGSLNIGDYEAALMYMQNNGAQPLAAKAMALVLVDVAKAQGVGVNTLLSNSDAVAVALNSTEAYTYINQLRGGSSQLSGSDTIDNSKSLRSRYLVA